MKSMKMEDAELINAVISRIEREFPDAVVIWTGTGCPDDDYDETENFEALWIEKDRYAEFQDLVWQLEEEIAEPCGYSIMVHALSPEVTKEYRWDEYQEAVKARRKVVQFEPVNVGWGSNGTEWIPRHRDDISFPEGQISGEPVSRVA